MYNIAIIGVGALGKRHIESLCELPKYYNIYAVEVNLGSIEILKERFPNVFFSEQIHDLPDKLEAVIIATNANTRRAVFEQLIEHSHVSNILFEKVLFQKPEDYFFVQNKLKELGIHAWVNCARREWKSYQNLRNELDDAREMHFFAIGGEWGIGCNGIHMLDIIEYLARSEVTEINTYGLEDGICESKRKGFYEFYGRISGKAGRCKGYEMICMKDSKLPMSIEIITNENRYIIEESQNRFMKYEAELRKWEKYEFNQVYQSQMTARVINTIIKEGKCNLPDYDSSMALHLKYIKALQDFFKKNGMEGDICPIT